MAVRWRCVVATSGIVASLACNDAVSANAVDVVADAIPTPLAAPGDVARGRALLVARENANCVLCHAIPDPALPFSGDVGPSLEHVGRRLTAGQLRLRIVDSARLNPRTMMPSYYRTAGLHDVATRYRGTTILSAQEVEDLVAYFSQLE